MRFNESCPVKVKFLFCKVALKKKKTSLMVRGCGNKWPMILADKETKSCWLVIIKHRAS